MAAPTTTSPATARVQVLLPADEGARFAAYCVQHGFKKSTLIARLVREYLEREDGKVPRKRGLKVSRTRAPKATSSRP
jgi:hypothetical protein